jgi:histidinol-phosphate aminotransferase
MTRPEPRDDLRTLAGYHSPQVVVDVRLNTNESPYPPPPEFVDRWLAAMHEVSWNRYPDRAAERLRDALGAFVGHPATRCCAATAATRSCRRSCSPTAARAGAR